MISQEMRKTHPGTTTGLELNSVMIDVQPCFSTTLSQDPSYFLESHNDLKAGEDTWLQLTIKLHHTVDSSWVSLSALEKRFAVSSSVKEPVRRSV
jgi:hypothetical protein